MPKGIPKNGINLGRFKKGHTGLNHKANSGSFKKGEHRSPSTEFKKGQISPMKGKKASLETREKQRQAKLKNPVRPMYWLGKKNLEHSKRMTGKYLGDKHHNWKGGTAPEYKTLGNWNKLRNKILERDNYTCQRCKITKDMIGIEHLCIDHIIPWRISFDNSETNLQTLCRSCNSKKVFEDSNIKVALVTGNSKGIGKEITNILREKNYFVYNVSRQDGFDLLNPEQFKQVIKFAKSADIICNNAGGVGVDKNKWELSLEKNYNITVKLTNAFLSVSRKWGRVITIASNYGTIPGHNPGFDSAKAAQIMFMKSMAKNRKNKDITFNCVSPCEVADAGTKKNVKLKAKDVANLVAFLCSKEADMINGQNIVIGEWQ